MKNTHLLWHLYTKTSLPLYLTHTRRQISLFPYSDTQVYLSNSTMLQLLQIRYAPTTTSHKSAADNLVPTLSFVIFTLRFAPNVKIICKIGIATFVDAFDK